MSDAKTVEAETRMQAEDLAKAEASVLIISISTKTIVGLPPLLGNKNLSQPSIFFLRGKCDASGRGMARAPTRVRTLWSQTNRQPAPSERAGPSGMATEPLERSEQEALRKTEEGMAGA